MLVIQKSNPSFKIQCDRAILRTDTITDTIEISGWAFAPSGIKRVEVHYKDKLIGLASYGIARHDVRSVFPLIKDSWRSGFSLVLPLLEGRLGQTDHSVKIIAITNDGQKAELQQSVLVVNLYSQYLQRTSPGAGTVSWMKQVSNQFVDRPSFNLVVPVNSETVSFLKQTISSIIDQPYPFWSLSIFHDTTMSHDAFKALHLRIPENKLRISSLTDSQTFFKSVSEDFIGFLRPGDTLLPKALFEISKFCNLHENLGLIYFDEDRYVNGVRTEHCFKPDWSPELLLSTNYIGQFFFIRNGIFKTSGSIGSGFSAESIYDLLLRAVENTDKIGHVPSVLYTKGGEVVYSHEKTQKIVREALSRRGIPVTVRPFDDSGSIYHTKRPVVGNPMVSIIIPTAYKNSSLLHKCLNSIVEKSNYKNYEIVLVDSSSGELSIKKLSSILPNGVSVRHVLYEGTFNYSKANNIGASQARGDFLIFLNDDTEVITTGWIEAMLEYAQNPEIGVVGAKLFYPNNTIQHGGVFLTDMGGGGRHAFRDLPSDSDGYWKLPKIVRNCSAVTFACVMVPKKVFVALRGLDENFKIECNDVDFCLRAREAGYRVIWTPLAELYHNELATRQKAYFEEDVQQFWTRWMHWLTKGDPYYNSNLSLDSDHYAINPRPLLVEHYEPYLSEPIKLEYASFQPIDLKSVKKILVVKLDHIGDVILSLPAVKMLRDMFPAAHITMLVASWAKQIVEKVQEVDQVLTFDYFREKSEEGKSDLTPEILSSLQNQLRPLGLDLAIDLRRHPETREILKLSGARYTIGYTTGKDDNLLSIGIKVSEEIQDIAMQPSKPHIAAQLCQTVLAISPANAAKPDFQKIVLPKIALQKKDNTVQRFGDLFEKNFVVGIHPGVGSSIRQWPTPYFANLIDLLVERDNANIVLFGVKKEKKIASQILDLVINKEMVASLVGEISLMEFMDAVQRCHLFIGNVSGPVHIAGALGAPTLAIFGGQVLPHEWHPLGKNTMSVRVALQCSPCYKSSPEQCHYDLNCLKFLWPEKVWDAVQQLKAISGMRNRKEAL